MLDNHKSVLTSFGIETSDDELDLPYIYWIPKMHKTPYKHRFIAGSLKCSTKPLSILLTKLLTHIKVAYTSGPIFEKMKKRYPIFSVQKIDYQTDQKHK